MKIKRVYDLTHPLFHNCPGWPDFDPPLVKRMLYQPRNICNVEWIEINTHTGTHIDAPYHFHADGKSMDQLPVETWLGEGIVADLSHLADRAFITAKELEKAAAHLRAGDILMLYTGRGKDRGFNARYLKDWPGVDESGARWLVERQVKMVGTDSLAIEAYGFPPEGKPIGHLTILGAGIPIIEEVFLEEIAPFGQKRWQFICLPLNLKAAGGSLARCLAIDEG